ncbi:MAG: hypothetical protein ACK4P3_03980 [Fimbriimonadaceae bacterium]
MLSLFIAAALATAQPQPQTLVLYRGASLSNQLNYWDVTDTVLSADEPNENFGGQFSLDVGAKRTMLIRFGDLNRAIGPNKRITDARLVFSIGSTADPKLSTLGILQADWGEGPAMAFAPLRNPLMSAPSQSATWRNRRSGREPIGWQQAGALGSGDARRITSHRTQVTENEFVISGLANEVQEMYEEWFNNHGFVLQFANEAYFASSQSPNGRPRLELTIEDAEPATGPDLSVVSIAPTNEFPLDPMTGAVKWPEEGEAVEYTAIIRNVGDAPSSGFRYRWVINGRMGAAIGTQQTLDLGDEVRVTTSAPWILDRTDPRSLRVQLRIEPTGADAIKANNALEIYPSGIPIRITMPQTETRSFIGSLAAIDWVNAVMRTWNEVVMPQSRFAASPDGSVQRVRVISVATGIPPGAGKIAMLTNATVNEDSLMGVGDDVIRQLSNGIDLMDLNQMEVIANSSPTDPGMVQIPDGDGFVTRGMMDRFPGLMLGGDTRDDNQLPTQISFPQMPVNDPLSTLTPTQVTDLYSATEVEALNASIARNGVIGNYLANVPSRVIVRVRDFSGNPVSNVEMSFFQMQDGVIPDDAPAFTVVTGDQGSVLLPNQDVPEGQRPTVFGVIEPNGMNGVFLIRALYNGTVEYGFLKLWQLVDGLVKTQSPVLLQDVYLNLPEARIDRTRDLAEDREVSSSGDMDESTLARLVTAGSTASVTLPGDEGSWVEVDLGRDRLIGEVVIDGVGPNFWEEFEVQVYATGETREQARPWSRELSWSWSFANRRDISPATPSLMSVAYRARPAQIRAVRILAKKPSVGNAQIARIRVHGVETLEGQAPQD